MMWLSKSPTTFVDYLRPILTFGKFFGSTLFTLGEPSRVPDLLYFVPVVLVLSKGLRDTFITFLSLSYYKQSAMLKMEDVLILAVAFAASLVLPTYYYLRRKTYRGLILEIDRVNEEELKEEEGKVYPNPYKDIIVAALAPVALTLINVLEVIREDAKHLEMVACFALVFQISIVQGVAIRRVLGEIHKQFLGVNRRMQANGHPLRMTEITRLVKVYTKISKTALDCNALFSVKILTTLLTNFIFLICSTHYTASFFVVSTKRLGYDWYFALPGLATEAFAVSHFFLVVEQWTAIASEAHKTATYIHDIWNNLASRNEIDNSTKHLQLISLQLYNSRLNFTAYGFFPLDWTLLHKIVGAVTTYVVILIQFEISSSTKNSSS